MALHADQSGHPRWYLHFADGGVESLTLSPPGPRSRRVTACEIHCHGSHRRWAERAVPCDVGLKARFGVGGDRQSASVLRCGTEVRATSRRPQGLSPGAAPALRAAARAARPRDRPPPRRSCPAERRGPAQALPPARGRDRGLFTAWHFVLNCSEVAFLTPL